MFKKRLIYSFIFRNCCFAISVILTLKKNCYCSLFCWSKKRLLELILNLVFKIKIRKNDPSLQKKKILQWHSKLPYAVKVSCQDDFVLYTSDFTTFSLVHRIKIHHDFGFCLINGLFLYFRYDNDSKILQRIES